MPLLVDTHVPGHADVSFVSRSPDGAFPRCSLSCPAISHRNKSNEHDPRLFLTDMFVYLMLQPDRTIDERRSSSYRKDSTSWSKETRSSPSVRTVTRVLSHLYSSLTFSPSSMSSSFSSSFSFSPSFFDFRYAPDHHISVPSDEQEEGWFRSIDRDRMKRKRKGQTEVYCSSQQDFSTALGRDTVSMERENNMSTFHPTIKFWGQFCVFRGVLGKNVVFPLCFLLCFSNFVFEEHDYFTPTYFTRVTFSSFSIEYERKGTERERDPIPRVTFYLLIIYKTHVRVFNTRERERERFVFKGRKRLSRRFFFSPGSTDIREKKEDDRLSFF